VQTEIKADDHNYAIDKGELPMEDLILAFGGWLSALLILYSASPSFLFHPYRHFVGLRIALGVIVLPAICVAGVFLITKKLEIACTVGFVSAALLYCGATWLERLLMTDEVLTDQERQEREENQLPFAPLAAQWIGSLLAVAVTTFLLVSLLIH
jgi:hypothetical protein